MSSWRRANPAWRVTSDLAASCFVMALVMAGVCARSSATGLIPYRQSELTHRGRVTHPPSVSIGSELLFLLSLPFDPASPSDA